MSRKIVIFASGSGSNAQQIVEHFKNNEEVEVSAFFTNNAQAGVIERGNRLGVPTVVFGMEAVKNYSLLKTLQNFQPDLIVLAGYLKLIPSDWIKNFPKKIINIHPALLPKFGGKGMYGMNVHKAVVDSGASVSGITIHYVSEAYDEGAPIFQAEVDVLPGDTPEDVQRKVQVLEHEHFPKVIESLLK